MKASKANNAGYLNRMSLNPNSKTEDIEKQPIAKEEEESEINKGEDEVDNAALLDSLQTFLFTNLKEKEKKIKLIIKTGNFNASKDRPPWYIILPNQRSKRFWDIFVCLAGILNVLMVTIDVSWNFECFIGNINTISITYTIFTTLFLMDIFFNCFTAYLDDKNIYSFDLKVIITNYFYNGLIIDVLSSLPYDRITTLDYNDCFMPKISSAKVPFFLFFLRVVKINKFFDLIERIFSKYTLIIRLVKLFTFIIFLANTAGNIFSGVSPTINAVLYSSCSQAYAPSSTEYYDCCQSLMQNSFWSIYFFSVYLGILLTLGTDFVTEKVFEQVFIIIIVIVSTIINATIYGNVAVMLANVSFGVSPILREKIDTMTEYMNFMKFDRLFKMQIEEYHLNIWYKQRNMMYDDSFFGDMSLALQKILLLLQYRPTFFLRNKLLPIISERFILDMIVLMKPKIYMTHDIIMTEGESTLDVFFASETSFCKVYIGGQWIKDLNSGDYFGEIAIFLRSRRRTATVLCYKDSDFLLIEGQSMQKLLRNYPEDYVRIKNRAIQTFISTVKFYPSNLFAKLVPNNNLKDYLFRKSIYLEDEEEDQLLNTKTSVTIDPNEYNEKVSLIIEKLTEVRNKLLSVEIEQ